MRQSRVVREDAAESKEEPEEYDDYDEPEEYDDYGNEPEEIEV